MFSFSKKNLTGVDIGAYSMKVVSLSGTPGAFTLNNASCVRLPVHNGLEGGGDSNGLISEIIKHQKIAGKRVAALISGPSLIFRHLYLPVMPDKDLAEAVRWEIRKETNIPDEELVADYVLPVDDTKTAEKTRSVIAFAAKKYDVELVMNRFKKAALEVRIIEVAPTSLLFGFDANNDWEEGVNYSALDIGKKKSTLAIFKNKRLAFTREIEFGGDDITTSLMSALGIDEIEAEEYKSDHGLEMPESGETGGKDVISSHVESLCSELQRSFDYYQAQFRGGAVAKLFLSGGSARLKGIEALMTDTIEVPSFVDDPTRGTKIPKSVDKEALKTIAPCLSIAHGLAVRMATG